MHGFKGIAIGKDIGRSVALATTPGSSRPMQPASCCVATRESGQKYGYRTSESVGGRTARRADGINEIWLELSLVPPSGIKGQGAGPFRFLIRSALAGRCSAAMQRI